MISKGGIENVFYMGQKMKEVTIKDIARRAGVSISTVSRVVNDNYPVRQEVRRRVEEAIKELEYRPNAIARSLRSSKTNLVALVVADLSGYFFMEAAKGLEGEISRAGYHLVVASSGGDTKKEQKLLETLIERKIDGLVIAVSDSEGANIKKCLKQGMPVVLIDREIKGLAVSQIFWRDFENSYRLVSLLIQKGHWKIAIVNVMLSNPNGNNRLKGYLRALEDAGIPFRKEYASPSNFSAAQACGYVKQIMCREDPPTALYCANNIMLEGTLQALAGAGLRIYEDVSVVAFGALECNKYIVPQITSAEQDSFAMGCQAGQLLLELVSGKRKASVQIAMDSSIIERGSVKKIG